MIKELYQQTVREVSLNVSAGRVESLRKKNVTKSGCRVYDNGYIGVAGCLGQPTADTWAAAERASLSASLVVVSLRASASTVTAL